MPKKPKSILGSCTAIVLLWLGCLNGVNALVRGSIDPLFTGSSGATWGWTADVLVNTDTASCTGTSAYVGVDSVCTGATLVSATGGLFDPYVAPPNAGAPGTPIPVDSSFLFTTSPSTFNDISVYFDGAAVVGLATGAPIGYYTLNPNASNLSLSDGGYFWLKFNYSPELVPSVPLAVATVTGQTADLILQALCPPVVDCIYDDNSTCYPNPDGSNNLLGLATANDIRLSVVPEPGSIVLIAGALLAAGLMWRRKQLPL